MLLNINTDEFYVYFVSVLENKTCALPVFFDIILYFLFTIWAFCCKMSYQVCVLPPLTAMQIFFAILDNCALILCAIPNK